MELPNLLAHRSPFPSLLSFAIFLFFPLTMLLPSQSAAITGNESDRLSLLAFKDRISLGSLTSWNNTVHFCRWEGITCSNQSQRVTALSLDSQGLVGYLSPSLGNLTFLQELSLGDNKLRGTIPSELGSLSRMRILNLTTNSFGGEVPANLSNCKELRLLDLSTNVLVGEIPDELTSLSKLQLLYLMDNNLTGSIPPSIGNLSSLDSLALGRNGLEGSIPDGIGRISGLNFLQVAENQLSGIIPQSLYNLSSLYYLSIATNQIGGGLSENLGLALRNLDTLYLGGNRLTGRIPATLSNASALMNLDLAYNNLTGSVPTDLGRLGGLVWLNFESNQLGTGGDFDDLGFITSLSNCTNLELLDIDSNGFGGVLPETISNLSTQLSMFIIGENQVHGSIPEGIDNLASLTVLRMEKNFLTGIIPASIGKLQNLQVLSLSRNKFSGQIPSSVSNLTQLNQLYLNENSLQGSIPSSLGNCTNLQLLELSQNDLNGTIPGQVIGISSLSIFLGLARNSLVGPLPSEVGNLKNLVAMDISENRLSGEIPISLGDCKSMGHLLMEGNMLQGAIPSSLSNLKGIQYIDLSRNNLSGQVPEYLESLRSLLYLNLSFNDLEGVVPMKGVFNNVSAISVLGNSKLCGGLSELQLPSCSLQSSKKNGKSTRSIRIIIPIVCVASVLVVLVSCLFAVRYRLRRSKKKPAPVPALEDPNMRISYKEILEATDYFSSENLIGQGSYGIVHKGTLGSNGAVVAVKVLNLHRQGASKSFMSECEALRNIRHRNLLKIITSCSSVDYSGNDFKALVYEFMPNGSLEKWLHPDIGEEGELKVLNILQRLNICIDVASALDYLHHQCQTPIVHCDLKPSNVLLDDDMTAHVGDFGLAKILLEDVESQIQTNSIGIKGSIGYVPPEYGMGSEVSTQGDVYSYGILVLEMFTGKRPTDNMFDDGSCLHNFVKMAFPEQLMEILDTQLLLEAENAIGTGSTHCDFRRKVQDCLVSVIEVGLSCSAESPKERMEMRDVATKMRAIKVMFLADRNQVR